MTPVIPRAQPLTLGHVDGSGKAAYAGPEHRACNRATATHTAERRQKDPLSGMLANHRGPRVSRHWFAPPPELGTWVMGEGISGENGELVWREP